MDEMKEKMNLEI